MLRMVPQALPNPRQALLSCVLAAVVAIACAALLTAAAVAPAPPAAVPFLALVCIGCPVFAAWEIPVALAVIRAQRANRQAHTPPLDPEALGELRRSLDDLPETEHPLGY
jgi:hypothetical protein